MHDKSAIHGAHWQDIQQPISLAKPFFYTTDQGPGTLAGSQQQPGGLSGLIYRPMPEYAIQPINLFINIPS
jgi:hypothetical protein